MANAIRIRGLSDRGLLIETRGSALKLWPGLARRSELAFRVASDSSPRTSAVGSGSGERWQIYSATRLDTPIQEGDGDLLFASGVGHIYRSGQHLRTETATGALIGSFDIDPHAQYRAELLSPNRLVTELPRPAIIDPTGKELVALAAPPGFGPRHGWNDEATELLFDHFSSGETGVRGQFDRVWNSLFGGLGVAGEGVHGEHIRIVNTKSGAVCFDLESEDAPFGLSRGYHADLSPDGRRVAVTTTRELRVYAVPDDCAKR